MGGFLCFKFKFMTNEKPADGVYITNEAIEAMERLRHQGLVEAIPTDSEGNTIIVGRPDGSNERLFVTPTHTHPVRVSIRL